MNDFDDFVSGYIDALLFSTMDESRDDGGDPLDKNYTGGDFSEESLTAIETDCRKFFDANLSDIMGEHTPGSHDDTNANHAGRDFWYTRAGHGCGFWDGDWPEAAGERLTAAAKAFGEVYPYVGDDGKLYYQ